MNQDMNQFIKDLLYHKFFKSTYHAYFDLPLLAFLKYTSLIMTPFLLTITEFSHDIGCRYCTLFVYTYSKLFVFLEQKRVTNI